ncbi:hypothetical protein [Laspinema olomoucense]|uniref:hypothetical protein n=1 Tax=Laspinema olomoucense TaxID=3231600 RepID=UPI0021BAC158|nr:hypothetical protein [Laspinema sp. D3c]MCT7996638.1 hypothetical protein [Laspinema sp. D3c]
MPELVEWGCDRAESLEALAQQFLETHLNLLWHTQIRVTSVEVIRFFLVRCNIATVEADKSDWLS